VAPFAALAAAEALVPRQRRAAAKKYVVSSASNPSPFPPIFSPMSLNNASVGGAERGIYILYDDVKSCPCEDVHVLWSILVESHGLPPPTPPVLRLTKR
jgi:hypothetical protein